jgi:hypothetical protein
MARPFDVDFLRRVCRVTPSPWDDQRFVVRSPTPRELEQIPDEYDGLAPYFKPAYDQGDIGSCVGHSTSIAMEVTNHLLDRVDDDLSAWDCYVKARKYDGLPDIVEGSNLLGAMKALQKEGICTEACWPTPTSYLTDPGAPCPGHEAEARGFGIDSYWQMPFTVGSFQAAIYGLTHQAAYTMLDGSPGKIPLVAAYSVYDSFQYAVDGVVPRVRPGDQLLGYHASVIRGWRLIDRDLYWINPNTWGPDVGDHGVFYLPADFDILEGWIIHNGPPTGPTPSQCSIGNGVAVLLNRIATAFRRQGRFHYLDG